MELRWIVYTVIALLLIVALLQQTRKPYDLPKIVWTHWDSEDPPEGVQKTVQRMRQKLPDWQVNFITTEKYLNSINQEEIPPGFYTLKVQHQADWIRMKLLKTYGGCWIDSGVILNQSINGIYRDCVSSRADLLVFKIKGFQTDSRYPIAENWFIMAPPNSPMINLWLEEYERAIKLGFKRYKERLKAEGVNFQKLMPKTDDVYLTQHACYQKVIQQRMPPQVKVVYYTAEESMYKLQAKECKWNKDCIKEKLKDIDYCKKIPYIKLRGGDRKNADLSLLLSEG